MTSRSAAPQTRGASDHGNDRPAADDGRMVLAHCLVGLLACSTLLAQQPQGQPRTPTQPQGIGGAGLLQGGTQGQGQGGQQQEMEGEEFGSIWGTAQPHQFEGFPTFPSRLQGYGNYPLPIDPTARDPETGAATLPLPLSLPLLGAGATGTPVAPRQPGWPDWVHAQSKKPLPFAPDQALLVRQVDRVWWRESDAEPFVPLYFHDKFATLSVGGEVEVRQVGRFELLLHESTRLETRGPTRLQLVALDEQSVGLALGTLTWVRLHASARVHDIELPDGSTLHIAEAEPAAAAASNNPFAAFLPAQAGGAAADAMAPVRTAWVEIVRADEPGAYGGRATMTNFGNRDVTWRHAFGEVVLHHGERVTLLLTPPATPIDAGLQPTSTEWRNDAGVVTCRAQRAAEVGWCGARVTLPAGTSVRFESLQGDAFTPRGDAPQAGG